MYNRYIPQADGSYCRSRIPDNPPVSKQHFPVHKEEPCCSTEPEIPCTQEHKPPCKHNPVEHHNHNHIRPGCPHSRPHPHQPKPEACPESGSIAGFLRQLLPNNFDTGDLLVVILLLLMAGDCGDDQNIALLTLVLYLFI